MSSLFTTDGVAWVLLSGFVAVVISEVVRQFELPPKWQLPAKAVCFGIYMTTTRYLFF